MFISFIFKLEYKFTKIGWGFTSHIATYALPSLIIIIITIINSLFIKGYTVSLMTNLPSGPQ